MKNALEDPGDGIQLPFFHFSPWNRESAPQLLEGPNIARNDCSTIEKDCFLLKRFLANDAVLYFEIFK